jgi:hypothetical protein
MAGCCFILGACHSKENNMPKNQTVRIINAGNDFERFWQQAQGKSFDVQARLWDKEVESKYQGMYDSLLYSKKYDKNWKERKEKLFKNALPKIKDSYPQIAALFGTFDGIANEEIVKFSKTFPNAKFDYPIYAIPSLYGFDGKAGTVEGKNALAFGVEALIAYKRDLHIMFSHECFHVYHMGVIGLDENVFVEKARLSLPLWLEGMATYVSSIANPGRNDAEILFSDKLDKLSPVEISNMAKDFSAVADLKVADEKNQGIYNKWFSAGYIGATPERAGYRLGLEVVRHIAKTNDIHQMVKWNLNEIHSNVVRALSEMTGTAR